MSDALMQLYGWAAYLSAVATIITFVTGILFFAVGGAFGKINDISSVLQVLFMVPVAIMSVRSLASGSPALGLIAALVGIAGMLVSAYGQSLLVLDRIDFEGSLKFFPAGGAIGIWLIVVCAVAAVGGQLPQVLAWTGILAGLGYVMTVVGFLRGGQQNPLFYAGGLVLGVGYPVWAIWLGHLIFSGRLG